MPQGKNVSGKSEDKLPDLPKVYSKLHGRCVTLNNLKVYDAEWLKK
jgi:hypothetical protein